MSLDPPLKNGVSANKGGSKLKDFEKEQISIGGTLWKRGHFRPPKAAEKFEFRPPLEKQGLG